ncbi:uncharacterized protein LOC121043740 [Herpailurus yagouaroundi]|uniref:uncharacterized protein LOC121043740 n=1 Tax=Herpailurus yagouaroundi TaxID=1608482 RepID=UPI001AD78FA0|nr:uncharacterized protein LOC121043740 [Puma yagouaroundi]
MFLGVEGITPVRQVEAAKYPRNKFCCLGAQSPRCWSPGWGSGLPRGRPQHFWFLWSSAQVGTIGKGSQGSPEKENPRQQRSLVKPKFLLQYPSLSLSRWLQKQHTPPLAGNARRPGAGPGPCRGCGVQAASGSNRERLREPLAASPKGEALVSEGEVSALELISGSPQQSGSPRRRLGGETSTGGPGSPTGCFCAASLPDPLSLHLSAHTHPHNGYRESELLKHHSENTADRKPLSPRQSFRSYKEDLLRTQSRDHQKKTTKP